MKIKDILRVLEQWAPLSLQENYDNCGLLVGSPEMEVESALLTLDVTEAVIDEAVKHNHKFIIAHHPIVFKGIKTLTGRNYVERVLIKAVKNDIAIYAIHTNLDNVQTGVNHRISRLLGLENCKVLVPKHGLLKLLRVYVPKDSTEALFNALFEAGAGAIGNYDLCGFSLSGQGSFRPNDRANPSIGQNNVKEIVDEHLVEVIFEQWKTQNVLEAMRNAHPYEEVAHQIVTIDNLLQTAGSGMVGNMPVAMPEAEFLSTLKEKMGAKIIRHTALLGKKVSKVALCGGSGSFLLEDAIRAGADVYISGDFTYHRFFDAEGKIVIADIGHYESEQFTPALIKDFLKEKMPTFAPQLSKVDTNPINYF